MDERLEFSVRVLETTIRVVYADITRQNADILVSSDDVHISMAGGVGASIRAAAGDAPREDAQKHKLPLDLGSVLLTGAGQLRAKYIIHTATLDFTVRQQPEALIPPIIQRVMDLASSLDAQSLALPLLGTGSAGMEKEVVLEHILRSLACYTSTHASTLRDVTVAVYRRAAEDHAEAERALCAELAAVRALAASWASAASPINTRMALLHPLLHAVEDDQPLRQAVKARITADTHELGRIFECPDTQPGGMLSQAGVINDPEEYERARKRLSAHLDDLSEELEHLVQLQRTQKRRLRSLEQQMAQKGGDTPPEIVNEVEDTTRAVEQREQRIGKISEQQDAARGDLDRLQQRWQHKKG
jgi:O-acetyl-ADP-ribose deacetylase